MLENATNLSLQIGENDAGFFSQPYADPILIAVLIGATIMIFVGDYLINRRGKHIERIQQEYGKLLKPDAVKLEYRRGALKYSSEKDLDFESFLSEVKKQKKYRKYKLDELYGAVKKAVDEYKDSSTSSPQRITSVLSGILKKEGLEFKFWIGEGDKPLEDFVETSYIQHPIQNFVNGFPLTLGKSSDGRYTLKCNRSRIAKATSPDKIERLKEVIEKVVDDDEVREAIGIYYKAIEDKDQGLKKYNNKLAEIIRDLRMYPPRGVLKR